MKDGEVMNNLKLAITDGINEYIEYLAYDKSLDYQYKVNNLLDEISSCIGKSSFNWAISHASGIYNSFADDSHGINHIGNVIGKALCILIDNPTDNLPLDASKIFIAGLWHDLFTYVNRKEHHTLASKDISKYQNKLNIRDKDLKDISMMIYRHRASSKEPNDVPVTHLEKILSDADRSYDLNEFITRCVSHHKANSPLHTESERANNVLEHLKDKYGTNGYANFYIVDFSNREYFDKLTLEDILKFIEI